MKSAIETGLEGLILKDFKSIYEPGARHWIKLKKDYLEGMADSCDLLVLGAYYGHGNKGSKLSVFLMGCYDKDKKKYKTVVKVGNGHTDEAIDKLQPHIMSIMTKIQKDPSKVPDWLDIKNHVLPDWLITDPKNTDVWEVSGSEFSKIDDSNHTSDGISIRFPRVTKIRDDKGPEDATTLQEIRVLYDTSIRNPVNNNKNNKSDDKKSTSELIKRSIDKTNNKEKQSPPKKKIKLEQKKRRN